MAISPHLDDVVLSIGSTVHALTSRAIRVDVVTLFAGDPRDERAPSYWDAQRGDRSGAQAATNRRDEDARACAAVGARPFWGDFQDIAYVRRRDPQELWAFLEPHIAGAELVLLPGWPLAHADHRYTTSLVLERIGDTPCAFYPELPYAANPVHWLRGFLRNRGAPYLTHILGEPVSWRAIPVGEADRRAKKDGRAAYDGEVASLGYRLGLARLHDRIEQGELLGLPASAQPPSVLGPLLERHFPR